MCFYCSCHCLRYTYYLYILLIA